MILKILYDINIEKKKQKQKHIYSISQDHYKI